MNIEALDLRCHISEMKKRAKLNRKKAEQHEAIAQAIEDEVYLIESEFESSLLELKQRK